MQNRRDRAVEPEWPRSQCYGDWLHRFELVEQQFEYVLEVCQICGQEEYFAVVDGRVDNMNYIEYHARQCLPKQSPLFIHEYPNSKAR